MTTAYHKTDWKVGQRIFADMPCRGGRMVIHATIVRVICNDGRLGGVYEIKPEGWDLPEGANWVSGDDITSEEEYRRTRIYW